MTVQIRKKHRRDDDGHKVQQLKEELQEAKAEIQSLTETIALLQTQVSEYKESLNPFGVPTANRPHATLYLPQIIEKGKINIDIHNNMTVMLKQWNILLDNGCL